jgi:hypothetical protein
MAKTNNERGIAETGGSLATGGAATAAWTSLVMIERPNGFAGRCKGVLPLTLSGPSG